MAEFVADSLELPIGWHEPGLAKRIDCPVEPIALRFDGGSFRLAEAIRCPFSLGPDCNVNRRTRTTNIVRGYFKAGVGIRNQPRGLHAVVPSSGFQLGVASHV